VAASLAVHAALLIALLPGGKPGLQSAVPSSLTVDLVERSLAPEPTVEAPAPVPPVLAAMRSPSPIAVPVPEARPTPAAPPKARAAQPGAGAIEVTAQPVTDRSRLGGYLTRRMNVFPAEIDRPVRLSGKIVVRYPQTALANGREDFVVAYILVDITGEVADVEIIQGSEEFADEVVAAVRRARFLPAENNLQPIRYPIALEFDFRADGTATAQAK
jgi:TonB family protein